MCRLFLMTVACLAILFGISGLYMMPKLIQRKIEERMQLKIGTKTFERFTRVPIPIKVKFYLFNVTNSEQVLRGLERPHFQEVGPFMYEQWRRRSIVDIVDNNRKITYREYKTFYSMWPKPADNYTQASELKIKYLDSDNDNNNVDSNHQAETNAIGGGGGGGNSSERKYILNPWAHNVTIINLPLLSMLTKLADLEENSLKRNIAAKIVSRLIREGNERILITKPVNELLFDGYKVGVMEAARELVSTTLGFNFESPLPRNKFGFFHGKNGTWKRDEVGELTIFTGRNESMDDFMLVDNWNGLRSLNTWPKNTVAGNRCNEIRGTDGSQHHPGVTRNQVLGIFSPMICTSLQIKFKEDTSCRDIPLLRFTTTPEMFAAPKKSARNACYCTIKDPPGDSSALLAPTNSNYHLSSSSSFSNSSALPTRGASSPSGGGGGKSRITNGRCYVDGLMDLSLCQKGAPIAASSPHFFNGDPMLAMAAGLAPRRDKHETHMDIEPMTGAVMRAASRAQLNAFVEQAALEVVEPSLIGHMTPMVAPLLWLEEAAEIDEKSSREFKSQLLNTVNKARRSFIYAIVLGVLLMLAVSFQYWYVTCYKIDPLIEAKRRELRNRKRQAAEELKSSSSGGGGGGGGGRSRSSRSRSPGGNPARSRRRRSSSAGSRSRAARLAQQRAVGARKSNLAAHMDTNREPLVSLTQRKRDLDDDDDNDDRNDSRLAQAGAAAMAVAAVLGAADAAATRNQRHANSNRAAAGRLRRSAPMAQPDDGDEDELSRRGLVENEWRLPENDRTTTASSAGGASSPATSGQDDQQQQPQASNGGGGGGSQLEPSTSDGLLGEERGPPSPGSSLYSD